MGLDESEKLILKEIVKDPKISDNQIALKTNIPVKTVNRKRKNLEDKGIVNYFAYIDHTEEGTGRFSAKRMYIVLFKYGISRDALLKKMPDFNSTKWEQKHLDQVQVGEHNGRLALFLTIESRVEKDIIEIFNVEVMNKLRHQLGHDCIHDTLVFPLDTCIKVHHNYMKSNMKQGKIKTEYPDDNIYV